MVFITLLHISLLIVLVNAHGYLEDPKPRAYGPASRANQDIGAQYSGGFMFHYYYRGIF